MMLTNKDTIYMRQLAMELVAHRADDLDDLQHLIESHGADFLQAMLFMARLYRNSVNGDIRKVVVNG